MKKIILLLLTLSLILGIFSSCSHKTVDPIDDQTSSSPSEYTSAESIFNDTTESNDASQSENTETDDRLSIEDSTPEGIPKSSYNIVKIGEQWYLQCDNYDFRLNGNGVAFDSMEDFRNCLNGNLSDDQLDWMKKFWKKDANGIKILDFNNLYYPDLPNGINVLTSLDGHIEWNDSFMYSLYFGTEDASMGGIFAIIMSSDDYDEVCDRELFNEYVLHNNEKQIIVSYKDREDSSLQRHRYELFIKTYNGLYAYVLLNSSQLLTDEYILSFGLQQYEG